MKQLKEIVLHFYEGQCTLTWVRIPYYGDLTRKGWHKLYKIVKNKTKGEK